MEICWYKHLRQDPSGPHVGPMNFAVWGGLQWEWFKTIIPFRGISGTRKQDFRSLSLV